MFRDFSIGIMIVATVIFLAPFAIAASISMSKKAKKFWNEDVEDEKKSP